VRDGVRRLVVAGTPTGRPRVTATVTLRPAMVRRTRWRCNACFSTASAISNRSMSRSVAPRSSGRSFLAPGSVCTRALPDTSTGRDMTMRRLPRFVRRTCMLSSARWRCSPERGAGCNTAETMSTRTPFADFGRARFVSATGVVIAVVIGRDARGGPPVAIDALSLWPESLATAAPTANPPIPATTMAATSFASPRSTLSGVRPYGVRDRPPGSRVRKRSRTSASAQLPHHWRSSNDSAFRHDAPGGRAAIRAERGCDAEDSSRSGP